MGENHSAFWQACTHSACPLRQRKTETEKTHEVSIGNKPYLHAEKAETQLSLVLLLILWPLLTFRTVTHIQFSGTDLSSTRSVFVCSLSFFTSRIVFLPGALSFRQECQNFPSLFRYGLPPSRPRAIVTASPATVRV